MTTYRFASYAAAERWATTQAHLVPILLGCDGRFWVPATPRIASRLMVAGYEVAA